MAHPGRHVTVVRALRGISSNTTRPRASPGHFDYPHASAYNNILLRRRYTTPAPTPSSSSSSTSSAPSRSTDAPPPPSQSEGSTAPQKKPKLDLRPAPIKPPSSTATSASTNTKGKVNAADPLKAPAPPVRKSASNMKQLKAKSPYYADKAVSAPKPEKTAKAPPPPPQQKPAVDASKAPDGTPLSGLGAAKAEAMQAVQDAEAHGILKPPPEGANWFRRTLHQAIELAKFYFRGVKLVYQRIGTVREIKKRLAAGGTPITREEFHLCETQRDDIKKIIPFLLIALVLEEVIPLIAIYVPGMLPSTCILPSQRDKIEAKRAEKAVAFRKQYAATFGELKKLAEMRTVEQRKAEAREMMYFVVGVDKLALVPDAPLALCGLLGLSTLGPDFMRTHRIRKRLSFLLLDDILLIKEVNKGMKVEKMKDRELAEALQTRGIPNPETLSRSQRNSLLNGWLGQAAVTSDADDLSRRLALVLTHA